MNEREMRRARSWPLPCEFCDRTLGCPCTPDDELAAARVAARHEVSLRRARGPRPVSTAAAVAARLAARHVQMGPEQVAEVLAAARYEARRARRRARRAAS